MRAGDVGALVAEATEKQLTHSGNAAGELLTWVAMLGLVGAGPAVFLEAQREFGHAFGCWLADGKGGNL